MDLSNKKEINSVPLRRVQGFKGDGTGYVENTPIDYLQDFAIVIRFHIPAIVSELEYTWGFYLNDVPNNQQYFMYCRVQTDGNVRVIMGDDKAPSEFEDVIIPYTTGDNVIVFGRRNNYVVGCVNDSDVVASSGQFLDVTLIQTCEPLIFGRCVYDTNTGTYTPNIMNDMIAIEYLEIQDTLTDAQILEFANLARFTDHSDYGTFNKNAYYPLEYNTKDYSGNNNNGTVTGTEQYEIVERGIKSINDAEVLSKRGFKFNGVTSLTLANSLQNLPATDFTIIFTCKLVKNAGDPWNTILATQNNDNNAGYSIRVLAYDGGSNYLNFSDEFSDGEQQIIAEIPNTIDIENTLHISFQYNSTDVLQSVWRIDGVEIPNTITNVRSGTRVLSASTWIGRMTSFGGSYFINGCVAHMKVFDSFLTENQVEEERKGNVLPALGYWPLQEDTKDYSNNGNDGIVTGTEQYETVQNGLTDWQDPVLP